MKWYRFLAAGAVLGLAVTACRSMPKAGVSALSPVASSSSSSPVASSSSSWSSSSWSSSSASSSSASPAGSATPSAPAPAATASSPAAASAVLFDCLGHGQAEPTGYILTCADADSVLDHLTWMSWTAQQAVAAGDHELNNCTPNCAEGRFINYPAIVTLWRSEPVSGHPAERYFTKITVRYTGPRPPAYMSNGQLVQHPAEWTQSLGPIAP
jgi:hypothetical protein